MDENIARRIVGHLAEQESRRRWEPSIMTEAVLQATYGDAVKPVADRLAVFESMKALGDVPPVIVSLDTWQKMVPAGHLMWGMEIVTTVNELDRVDLYAARFESVWLKFMMDLPRARPQLYRGPVEHRPANLAGSPERFAVVYFAFVPKDHADAEAA